MPSAFGLSSTIASLPTQNENLAFPAASIEQNPVSAICCEQFFAQLVTRLVIKGKRLRVAGDMDTPLRRGRSFPLSFTRHAIALRHDRRRYRRARHGRCMLRAGIPELRPVGSWARKRAPDVLFLAVQEASEYIGLAEFPASGQLVRTAVLTSKKCRKVRHAGEPTRPSPRACVLSA